MAASTRRVAFRVAIGLGALVTLAAWARAGFPLPSVEKRWSIGVYRGHTPFDLVDQSDTNPVLTAAQITDVRARFVADPFLVIDSGNRNLFFEVFNAGTHQGDIGWATSRDGKQWTYQRIVLDEPFHVSYPYVFRANGAYFMLPETIEHGSVRLYRADPFPSRWRLVADLFAGQLADPSLIFRDGRWWIFGANPGGGLLIYHAQSLEGPWTPHPANPVLLGTDRTRPGGRMFEWQGRLFRFAQDDTGTYGRGASPFEVTTLTTEAFAQQPGTPAFTLRGTGAGWNTLGTHHADVSEAAGDWVASVDGYQHAWMFGYRRLWPRIERSRR